MLDPDDVARTDLIHRPIVRNVARAILARSAERLREILCSASSGLAVYSTFKSRLLPKPWLARSDDTECAIRGTVRHAQEVTRPEELSAVTRLLLARPTV